MKTKNPTKEETLLAIADLKATKAGREFCAALKGAVHPYGKLDIVYQDRARCVLFALIQAELNGTLSQSL